MSDGDASITEKTMKLIEGAWNSLSSAGLGTPGINIQLGSEAALTMPTPSEGSPIESLLDLDSLWSYSSPHAVLRMSQPSKILRANLDHTDTLRKMLLCISSPETCVFRQQVDEEKRDDIGAKLAALCAELLTEPSAFPALFASSLLDDLFVLMERPAPLPALPVRLFKMVVERLMQRAKVHMMSYLRGERVAEKASSRAESVRAMPVFRMFRHLESPEVVFLIRAALAEETPEPGAPTELSPEEIKRTRWSNRFDLVMVLLHKLQMDTSLEGEDRSVAEDACLHAGLLLAEVLRVGASTSIDLLKAFLQRTGMLLDIAFQEEGEPFNEDVFFGSMGVVLGLAHTLSEIWLPQRKTKVIVQAIENFAARVPRMASLFRAAPKGRIGRVRLNIAHLVATLLGTKLCRLCGDALMESRLVHDMLDVSMEHQHASIYHQAVWGAGIVPLVREAYAQQDEVMLRIVENLLRGDYHLWRKVRENYYNYNDDNSPATPSSLNGFYTELTNALVEVSWSFGLEGVAFLSNSLAWVNELQQTPLTSELYSKKFPRDEQPPSHEDDVEDEDSSSDDPPPAIDFGKVKLAKRVEVSPAQGSPVPLRIAMSEEQEEAEDAADADISSVYWSVPLPDIDFEFD